MRVVVPFDATAPKTRLAPVLDPTERRAFAECMLRDVVDAVGAAGGVPQVVATEPLDDDPPTVRVDDRPLSAVVNEAIDRTVGGGGAPLAVVVADLALATPTALSRLFEAEGDVVVAPGRGAGTNALVVRTPDFHVDYHGTSFLDHLDIARAAGVEPTVVDSLRLATDVDEPADLVEVLVHGTGRAHEWLDARFELVVDDNEGRVGLGRR
ncbi:2-phospho-L-lactate guanylyltransferase [Salinigranum marinum]|uniref:2-phospho-L-lactate guanylyltransferase n=1 Tax=Salinigranum marinum TaxID=1515595 RepID=UPI002989AC6B|nr:2-phospho-L-lactate guanylyltransferase [Salinigranum marinum]